MKWKKIAHIDLSDISKNSFFCSHLSNPIAYPLEGSLLRVFFSSRDQMQRSRISYFDYDLKKSKIVNDKTELVLDLGEAGTFDDSGLSIACIVEIKNKIHLYYLGWNLAKNVPFRNSIGLAVAENIDSAFKKISVGPIMDRDIYDPMSLSYPSVIYDKGLYKMWYGSHKKWGRTTDDMVHALKYAESQDGIHWIRSNKFCLDCDTLVHAYSKPCVIYENNRYKMWYSYRGKKYRIGYAESKDGLTWTRKDHEVGIDVSSDGWDSEMIEYPFVFDFEGSRYMLYNGNSYGKTGMGIAILQ